MYELKTYEGFLFTRLSFQVNHIIMSETQIFL